MGLYHFANAGSPIGGSVSSFAELVPDETGHQAYQGSSSSMPYNEWMIQSKEKTAHAHDFENAFQGSNDKQGSKGENMVVTNVNGAYDFTPVFSLPESAQKVHVAPLLHHAELSLECQSTQLSLSATEPRRAVPGAVAVHGLDYSDHGDWSGHTSTWSDPNNITSHSAKSSIPEDLIAATLVEEEEPVMVT